jgi:hypothetical protein
MKKLKLNYVQEIVVTKVFCRDGQAHFYKSSLSQITKNIKSAASNLRKIGKSEKLLKYCRNFGPPTELTFHRNHSNFPPKIGV